MKVDLLLPDQSEESNLMKTWAEGQRGCVPRRWVERKESSVLVNRIQKYETLRFGSHIVQKSKLAFTRCNMYM
jgi:hypothetical protein